MIKHITYNTKYINHNFFPIVDKKKDKIHISYNNLKKTNIDIAINEYMLSKSNEKFDKNDFESFKKKLIENSKNTKKNNNILQMFPYINLNNYQQINNSQNEFKSIETETTKELLNKLHKRLKIKVSNANIKKKHINKNSNLKYKRCLSTMSLISKKTIESEYINNEHSYKKRKVFYKIPNSFLKSSLNYSLSQILSKAKNEEDKTKEERIKMINEMNGINNYDFISKLKSRNRTKPIVQLKKKHILKSDTNISKNKTPQKLSKQQNQIISNSKIKIQKKFIKKINLSKNNNINNSLIKINSSLF
jgi:hypothetical protein